MSKPEFLSFSSSELMPQEEVLEVKTSKSELNIGIPREIFRQEKRVGLTPDAVQLLVSNGHKVVIEKGAGEGANYSDKDYEEAGGEIAYSKEKVFQSDIILKIEPPSLEEIGMMKHRQTLISALQLRTQNKEYFQKLMEKKITALSFENIADESGIIPVVRSMSEIAGSTSVLVAAECLSNANEGKGYMLGGVSGIPPTDVVIIGAGTVGVYAAKTALGLGATVKVFDKSVTKLRRLQGIINIPIYTCVIQPKILEKALMRCDVAIGAIRSDTGRTPTVVTEDMVSKMKAGSVIIDISIDQGGCFETSELCDLDHPTIRKYDVIHYCVPNIASRVSRTASFSLSNILAPLLLSIGDAGGIEEILRQNSGVNRGLYICKGILVSKAIGDWFDLPFAEDSRLLY
tara:strand:- start:775 stop:1980 length:1206 start_codon:yes stop_codon:yes gene_type:complete